MSIKVKWLDARQIKNLRREIEYVGSEQLKLELDDFIESNEKNEGEYIANLLTEESIRELEEIRKNYLILSIGV